MSLILLSSLDQSLEKLLPVFFKNISASFNLVFGISCVVQCGDEYPIHSVLCRELAVYRNLRILEIKAFGT